MKGKRKKNRDFEENEIKEKKLNGSPSYWSYWSLLVRLNARAGPSNCTKEAGTSGCRGKKKGKNKTKTKNKAKMDSVPRERPSHKF